MAAALRLRSSMARRFACLPGMLLVAVIGCRQSNTPPPASAAAPVAPPPVQQASAEAVQSMSDLSAEYESLQRQADDTNKRMVAALARYQKRQGGLPPNFGPDLTDEQRQMLAERIQQERASTRTLLQDILDRDQQIRELRTKISGMESRLPDHVTVKAGDSHEKLAINYLIKKGVSAQQAFDIVSQLSTADTMVPGFTAWMFYDNGQFGTWVTRGSAAVTPQEHQRRMAKLLEDERDDAQKMASDLKVQVTKLQDDVANERAEAAAMMAMAAAKEAERASAEAARIAAENTVRYSVGARNLLQKTKVIDGRMKLLALPQADLLSLNAATTQAITIDAALYGLKRLRKVTLVPEIFKEDVDYRIQRNGLMATIELLNPAKFAHNQFVVALE